MIANSGAKSIIIFPNSFSCSILNGIKIGLLKDIDNIEFMQGYYFYKPLEVDEFISLVKTFNLKIPLN